MSNDKALATTSGQEMQRAAQLGEMSVQAIVARKRKLVEVMEAVMTEGVHYGRIPGCGDKPTLYKAGAEVLATVFGLAPTFVINERDLGSGHREYQVICRLTHIGSGMSLGEGVGTCSTMESKYRWRRGERKCPECGKPSTIIKGKAEYGGGWICFAKKGGCGAKFKEGDASVEAQSIDKVENPDVADVYNTVLKMAKKRAQVDCTLTATGASDILTQDLEDLPQVTETREAPRPDAVDAEFTEARRFDLSDIDRAQTEESLRSLVPAIAALPNAAKDEARRRFGARLDAIRQAQVHSS